EGELRRIIAHSVFCRGCLTHLAQLVVVHCIDNLSLFDRSVRTHTVSNLILCDVASFLNDGPHKHVSQWQIAKHNSPWLILAALSKHAPLIIKFSIHKRSGSAEICKLCSMFWRSKFHLDFYFIALNFPVFIVF